MKLLVFAQTPPPLHGQSVMVSALVQGLADDPDIRIFHVNPRLSHDHADIGRWRVGKVFALLRACGQALQLRLRHGPMFLYYVPAPAKRGAIYRDWVTMLLCRPFFRGLVLHWHAAGLGAWASGQSSLERALTRRRLGAADLAIVLGESLRRDAAVFAPRQIAIVRNGIPDPCPGFVRPSRDQSAPFTAVFLGLCIPEKGLFDAIAGVAEANRRRSGPDQHIRLIAAGTFPTLESHARFEALPPAEKETIRLVGFVSGADKHMLLAQADILIFATYYPHETQGLVVAEAFAHDLPVIVSRWRAVHEGLPPENVYVVDPGRVDQIAEALLAAAQSRPPAGTLRQHFSAHLTLERHLASLKAALLQLESVRCETGTTVGASR